MKQSAGKGKENGDILCDISWRQVYAHCKINENGVRMVFVRWGLIFVLS